MSAQPAEYEKPVVLFDGVCNLCASSVQFIIARDRTAQFRFASLQSDFAISLLEAIGYESRALESVVLIEAGQVTERSTAALRIARRLTFPWWLAYGCLVVPRPLRDWIYDQIAARRYRWFGKMDECWLPTPALRDRFLDLGE